MGVTPGAQETVPEDGVVSETEFDENLGVGARVTDKYGGICFVAVGGPRPEATVTDPVADGVHFHVCVNNVDGVPGHCQGAPDGGNAVVQAAGGPGLYLVDVFKTPGGTVEAYDLEIHCETAGGAVTPSSFGLLQDE